MELETEKFKSNLAFKEEADHKIQNKMGKTVLVTNLCFEEPSTSVKVRHFNFILNYIFALFSLLFIQQKITLKAEQAEEKRKREAQSDTESQTSSTVSKSRRSNTTMTQRKKRNKVEK